MQADLVTLLVLVVFMLSWGGYYTYKIFALLEQMRLHSVRFIPGTQPEYVIENLLLTLHE